MACILFSDDRDNESGARGCGVCATANGMRGVVRLGGGAASATVVVEGGGASATVEHVAGA